MELEVKTEMARDIKIFDGNTSISLVQKVTTYDTDLVLEILGTDRDPVTYKLHDIINLRLSKRAVNIVVGTFKITSFHGHSEGKDRNRYFLTLTPVSEDFDLKSMVDIAEAFLFPPAEEIATRPPLTLDQLIAELLLVRDEYGGDLRTVFYDVEYGEVIIAGLHVECAEKERNQVVIT